MPVQDKTFPASNCRRNACTVGSCSTDLKMSRPKPKAASAARPTSHGVEGHVKKSAGARLKVSVSAAGPQTDTAALREDGYLLIAPKSLQPVRENRYRDKAT